jgi:hypothetical protein
MSTSRLFGKRIGVQFVSVAGICLAASCTESEESCYKRISSDFAATAERASKAGHHERAIKALESSISATVIFQDDDRNICDYVTADIYLERK